MKFRTAIETLNIDLKIDHSSNLFFIGSCFSENIGNKVKDQKINTIVNPFGVLYNPISIELCLESIINQRQFQKDDLNENNGLWFSFLHHSSFSNTDPIACLEKINSTIRSAYEHIKNADILFITYGTAMIYINKESNKPVGNCHKLPAKQFERKQLNVHEVIESQNRIIEMLLKINPDLQVVFTISPVRHLKDGLINNSQSKSLLNVAVHHQIAEKSNCHYFPAYEIQIDDLRDYRFYDEDLAHPNNMAVEYIMQYFSDTFYSDKTKGINTQVEKIVKAVNHRFLTNNKKEINSFVLAEIEKAKEIEDKHKINLSEEISQLRSKIN